MEEIAISRKDLRIRDPFIFVEDNVYYLIGSSGNDPWNVGSDLKLYKSYDLEYFCFVKKLVNSDILDGYKNVWAPELHKYNGKYYIVVSLFRDDLGRGSVILVSDKLDGEYTFLTGEYITPAGWGCLDATLFVDNKEPYLCFSNEWTTPITNDGDGALFIAKLSKDLTKLETKPKKIISGKYHPLTVSVCEGVGYVAEGPYIYREGDKIVLLWSTFTDTGYSVFKSQSDSVMGEYSIGEVVYKKDGGHCMMFYALDGKRKIAFHQPNSGELERLTVIDY